jgi:cobalt-zinc-cadmium efflux system outer membrane protein
MPPGLPLEPAALPTGDLVPEVLARTPELRALESEIRQAESLAALARKSGQPDYMVGLTINVLSPGFVRPELGVTLPIWLDKIEAAIAAAEAQRAAAGSRLAASRLEQVMKLADATFQHRDARRRLLLVRDRLLPRARTAFDVAKESYATSRADVTSLLDAERSVLDFRLEEARSRREMDAALALVTFELLARLPDREERAR